MRLQLAVLAMLLVAGCASPDEAEPAANATEDEAPPADADGFAAPVLRAPAVTDAHLARDAPDLTYALRLLPRSTPLDLAQMSVEVDGEALGAESVRVEALGAEEGTLGANESARVTLALPKRPYACDVLHVNFTFAEGPTRPTRLQVPVPAEDDAEPLRLQRVDASCVPPATMARPATGVDEEEAPAAPQQRVTGVYGVRNSTTRGLWDLKFMLESPAGANATDLTKLVVRYEEGRYLRTYTHGTPMLPDGAPPQPWFHARWIRGDGADRVMQPGDLVEIHVNLVDHELAERTDAGVTILPEGGDPIRLHLRTPATYASDTIVTIL